MIAEETRVLVVDDDPNLTDLLVDTLEVIGYESRAASSAQQALTMLKGERFSLVITDINMPEMSGIELLQRIKEVDSNLPVMLITGVGSDEIKQEAYEFGADGFLSKPFRIGKIEREIGNLLKGIQRRRVLLVDDNDEFLNSAKERLETLNNVVYTAGCVQEAKRAIDTRKLDMVITDFMLPDGDGINVYLYVKSKKPDLPVILVTAYATAEVLEKIRKSGITRFMPKPIDYSRLEDEFTAVFGGATRIQT
jgi:DNA-binding NtrC family response regulator